MEQFNLEEYLENPSRKVVTRDGREIEILKTDFRGYKQIIGVIKNRDNKDDEVERWDGQGYFKSLFGESKYDLFFVDEGEKLTEFEKAIYQYICSIVTACDGEVFGDKELKPIVKGIAKELLDLARKELEKEVGDKCWEAHLKGEEEALKSLPKWKKANVFVSNEFGLTTRNDDLIITHNGYQIKLSDLKSLPKEE